MSKSLKLLLSAALFGVSACSADGESSLPFGLENFSLFPASEPELRPLKSRPVVVCRSKQCAPAKLSMSREYIHNSLLHLFGNNDHKTALICEADAASHVCTENFISVPFTVGVTPASLYIDSVKITDSIIETGNKTLRLVLNYNVSYNGQKAECVPSQTLAFVKTVDNIIMEDAGYACKMTTVGQTTIKTLVSVDYIDLDYGFIGGYYSIGASGPAFGGGTGYMIFRLPKDAYPLDPTLKVSKKKRNPGYLKNYIKENEAALSRTNPNDEKLNDDVQIFPIKQGKPEIPEAPEVPAKLTK